MGVRLMFVRRTRERAHYHAETRHQYADKLRWYLLTKRRSLE